MNRTETLKIFSVLYAEYGYKFSPKGMSKIDADAKANLWEEMFRDTPYELVGAAVKAYIATTTNGEPPNVGKIKDHIKKLTQQEEMTEQEAVNLIRKACSNSCYNSVEEFNKLPPVLQRLAGSPNQLREWAVMDTEVFNSVVSSNLMRSYKVVAERERQTKALPGHIRAFLEQTANNLLIEG